MDIIEFSNNIVFNYVLTLYAEFSVYIFLFAGIVFLLKRVLK